MNIKTVPISLVSTVSQASCSSIYAKLDSLGYKEINTIDCGEFVPEAAYDRRVFIVPINNKWQFGLPSEILTFLKQIHHQPVLGVLPSTSENPNSEALIYSNEFLYWPCASREIDLRIKRLANLLQSHFREESESHICDEFLSLNMVGSSPAFVDVLRQIKKISCCDAPVLIEGESGTGKELSARAIHYIGSRRDYPFVPVNCGAIPDSLLENELFGHRQGAFTDAKNSQEGLVCQANGGTLFLDEVETFSPKGQVVLLRFLQDLQYKSLGSSQNEQANVRIIAASNAKLEELVDQGKFRKDLYYRLNIMPITMPPLSQRGKDVFELAEYFLNKFRIQYNQPEKRLDYSSTMLLIQYNWPGNVRELENLLHREFLFADAQYITLELQTSLQKEKRRSKVDRRQKRFLKNTMRDAKAEIVRHFEIEYLNNVLNKTNGNVTMAAKIAGKERRSLGKLIKKHGLNKIPSSW